jgi:hypothetical protein
VSKLLPLDLGKLTSKDKFQLCCVRIHVNAFHFFANPANPDAEALSRLYSLCLSATQQATALSQTTNLVAICPSFIDRTITLTGFIILKLVRSPQAQHFDLAAGEQAYFQAVNFSKSMSLQHNDLSARAAAIMTSLWGSTRIFRRRDGRIEALGLRLRTRLSMSISFDMFWYWREEFGNMLNPYSDDKGSVPGDDNQSVPSTGPAQPETPRKGSTFPNVPTSANSVRTEFERRELTGPTGMGPPGPDMKLPPDMMQQPGGMMGIHPRFEGYDSTNVTPVLDQFLDYDWAASFDFSNDWPNPTATGMPGVNSVMPQLPLDNPGYGQMHLG